MFLLSRRPNSPLLLCSLFLETEMTPCLSFGLAGAWLAKPQLIYMPTENERSRCARNASPWSGSGSQSSDISLRF